MLSFNSVYFLYYTNYNNDKTQDNSNVKYQIQKFSRFTIRIWSNSSSNLISSVGPFDVTFPQKVNYRVLIIFGKLNFSPKRLKFVWWKWKWKCVFKGKWMNIKTKNCVLLQNMLICISMWRVALTITYKMLTQNTIFINDSLVFLKLCVAFHSMKSVHMRRFSSPYFSAFGLNMDQKNSEYGHFSRSAWLMS